MSEPFKIGIAGLGTVGIGVVKTLIQNKKIITQRAGREIEIVAISARNKDQDRGINIDAYQWVDDAAKISDIEGVDAVVEMIGGEEGVAAQLVRSSLQNKCHVVTANKALVAHYGLELATIAEENNVCLMYEAAVAGGIPIIKAMREGLAANEFSVIYGILNGTCNYILTKMQKTGKDFAEILKEAQEIGYAESDPALDIEGIDAAHKLCILTSLAFGVKPDFDALEVTGISHINAIDIKFADEFGYCIKLLGIARCIKNGVMQVVEPCLVPKYSQIGKIDEAYNAVNVQGDLVQTPLFIGKGAGEGPTASSIVADIIDIARGKNIPAFGIPVKQLKNGQWISPGSVSARYYMRMMVTDKPGVIAAVSAILRDKDISIEGMVQSGRSPGQSVPVVLTLHETQAFKVQEAAKEIAMLDCCFENPCVIRIEEL